MGNIPKIIFAMIGGAVGWIVEEFQPTFPLVIVAVVFILYDAFTAYQLDKRVHKKYPDETKRHEAKFTSFAFGKVISHTIPKRLSLIFLAYLVEHWVFIHVNIPLSYIITGAICFEQAWSILENETRPSATLTCILKISRRNVNANPKRRTSNEALHNERNDA